MLPAPCTASLSACMPSCQQQAWRAVRVRCCCAVSLFVLRKQGSAVCVVPCCCWDRRWWRGRLGVCVQMALRVLIEVPIAQLQCWRQIAMQAGAAEADLFRLLADAPACVC